MSHVAQILDFPTIICAGYTCVLHIHSCMEECTFYSLKGLIDKKTRKVSRDSFVCVTGLICMCYTTRPYVCRDASVCMAIWVCMVVCFKSPIDKKTRKMSRDSFFV